MGVAGAATPVGCGRAVAVLLDQCQQQPPRANPRGVSPYGAPARATGGDDDDDDDVGGGAPYFRATGTISEFRDAWSHLADGAKETHTHDGDEVEVSIAGRVLSKRVASKKLVFLDVESGGQRVQVMANEAHFLPVDGDDADVPTGRFTTFRPCMHALQRGDIIGVSGFPARTQLGELSLVPRSLHF